MCECRVYFQYYHNNSRRSHFYLAPLIRFSLCVYINHCKSGSCCKERTDNHGDGIVMIRNMMRILMEIMTMLQMMMTTIIIMMTIIRR